MNFRIDAFVGPLSTLREWKRAIPSALVFSLTDDLGLVPLTDELRGDLRRHLKASAESERKVIELWGAGASKGSTVAFISADYYIDFNDDGTQTAVVWTNHCVVQSDVFINEALQLLGVRAEAGKDEFDTVGLGRYPDTESWAAAVILEEAASSGAGAVPGLIKGLNHQASQALQKAVRREAAKALGRHGCTAKEAIPALVASAKTDSDLYVREEATRALGLIGPDSVPALIELMRTHGDKLTRANAATALGDMGKEARAAVPAMIEALHEPEDLVRLVVARAVGKMYVADRQLGSAFEALAESATNDRSDKVRISAVRTLASLGPEATPTLIRVLKTDRDWLARTGAAGGLGDFGRENRETVRALAEALFDPQVPVRIAAAQALGRIQVNDRKAVEAFEQALNDDDGYVRKTAREALDKIRGASSQP